MAYASRDVQKPVSLTFRTKTGIEGEGYPYVTYHNEDIVYKNLGEISYF